MALEVIPGKSVGEFILGSPIRDAIRFIKQRSKDIPEARLMCHKDELLALDIVIDINTMLLRFDPVTQRLKMIEIYDIATQSLAYDGVEFWCVPLQERRGLIAISRESSLVISSNIATFDAGRYTDISLFCGIHHDPRIVLYCVV